MQTQHILQLSNNHTVTFQRGGGKVLVAVKNGDQQIATGLGEVEDYSRMFDLIVGPPSTAGHDKPGPGPTQQMRPQTGKPADTKTEPSKK